MPVRQEVGGDNYRKHINRRRELYRLLGIVPAAVRNSDVIEFGPGSGDNALFTDRLQPNKYKFVEGSESGYKLLKEKIEQGTFQGSNQVELELSLIENFQDPNLYDFVICEGLLPGQQYPEEILMKVASFVRPGGVLIITTATYISLLADIMRRMLYPFFRSADEQYSITRLINFFEPHLKQLGFVSRLPADWVMDSIVHPWGDNYQFSMPEAIRLLSDDFEAYGSSPLFFQNWQWYKEFVNLDNGINQSFIEQYQAAELSFLNRNEQVNLAEPKSVIELSKIVGDLYHCHRLFWKDGKQDDWLDIKSKLNKIASLIQSSNPNTFKVVKDYIQAVDKIFIGVAPEDVDFHQFESFWGKGQQYLSLIRK